MKVWRSGNLCSFAHFPVFLFSAARLSCSHCFPLKFTDFPCLLFFQILPLLTVASPSLPAQPFFLSLSRLLSLFPLLAPSLPFSFLLRLRFALTAVPFQFSDFSFPFPPDAAIFYFLLPVFSLFIRPLDLSPDLSPFLALCFFSFF